ncbi:MAG: esterase TesA [Pseudomonadota bacterium]
MKSTLLLWLAWLFASFSAYAETTKPVILVYGDSLSAAYGLSQKDGWVALLSQKLEQNKFPHKVVNASISGETTFGGATRIETALKQHKPAIIIVELGGNDGLRGLPLTDSKSNFEKILRASNNAKAKILLVGMRLPPNYGRDYTEKFHAMYATLAKQYKAELVPFMLEGVADSRENFQADNIHPTAKVQPQILENVWRPLQPMLMQKLTATKKPPLQRSVIKHSAAKA